MRDDRDMDFSTADLLVIASALTDIERGLTRASRRNAGIELNIDNVPVSLRGTIVGHAVLIDGKMHFRPVEEVVGQILFAELDPDPSLENPASE